MFSVHSAGSARLLLVHHVARRLNKSVRTVRWYAETGRLPAIRTGKLWRFDEAVVEAYKREHLSTDKAA